jgi:RNA polymerase sigma-70 factor (ECF subfamily)
MGVRSRLRGCLTADERGLLEGLFLQVGPRLVAYVRHAYGLTDDADDIVADTFCRAARNVRALRESRRHDLYLLTVARNLCRDRFRRARPRAMTKDSIDRRPVEGTPPAEVADLADALKEAILGLPAGLREVVVLRLSTGLKFEEIANLLSIPLGTALSRMYAAIERLKTAMGCIHER